MIDAALADAAADARLSPLDVRCLTALHRRLDYFHYRPVKIAVLADAAHCARSAAYDALGRLEEIGYLVAAEGQQKPRHFRLATSGSPPQRTSQAA